MSASVRIAKLSPVLFAKLRKLAEARGTTVQEEAEAILIDAILRRSEVLEPQPASNKAPEKVAS